MALRLASSTCRSARFRRDGWWEQSRGGLRPRRAGAGGRRLRCPGTRQRPAALAADPGQRHDHRQRRQVQPAAVGLGPERSQQIPQNQRHIASRRSAPGPRSPSPSSTANQTDFDSHLEVRGPRSASSGPIVANGNGTLQAELPTGSYTLIAADIPAARPAHWWSAPTAPPPKTTCCCRKPARRPAYRSSVAGLAPAPGNLAGILARRVAVAPRPPPSACAAPNSTPRTSAATGCCGSRSFATSLS